MAEACEDARALYVGLDAGVFLPPDPADDGFGRWMVDHLIAEAARPDQWVRVAQDDADTVSFLTASLHHPDDHADRDILRDSTRRHVVIDTLVVRRSHWHVGVGRALIDSVETWAQQQGASLLKVGTYAHGPAVDFHQPSATHRDPSSSASTSTDRARPAPRQLPR